MLATDKKIEGTLQILQKGKYAWTKVITINSILTTYLKLYPGMEQQSFMCTGPSSITKSWIFNILLQSII